MSRTPVSRDRPALWFAAIAAAAFLLRLVYLLQLRRSDPLFYFPQMDSLYHHQWALAVAAGREFIHDAFFRAPLYPYFLGLVYKLLGPNLMAARLVQAAMGSASCGLVYLLARRVAPNAERRTPDAEAGKQRQPRPPGGEAVARVSGFVMAAYPLAIYFDGELLIACLLLFLLLLGFVLLLRSRDTDRQWWLPGLAFGLAAIARPNVLAFVAVLPVWLFLEYRRRAWPRLAWVWGAVALVILPVAVRNYAVSRQFVPIAWQGGTNFYIGNSPESDGVTAILPGTRGSWWGGYDDAKRLAEQAAGRPLAGAQVDRYWMGKGLEFWRRQPGRALRLTLRKLYLWFSGYEVSNDRDLYYVKRYSFLDGLLFRLPLLKFPFGVVLPLALAGAYLARRAWRRLLPLYLFAGAYSLSFVVFFVTARYRMPLVPLAVILAVMAVAQATRLGGRQLVAPGSIFLASFLLLNLNLAGAGRRAEPSQNMYTTAVGLYEQGRKEEALALVRTALAQDSATNLLTLEATILLEQGQAGPAIASARAAARLHPSDADAALGVGNMLAEAGQLDSAQAWLRRALELDPYSVQALDNMGSIALSRHDLVTARSYYEAALKANPNSAQTLFYLGLVDYYGGDKAQARSRWRQALKLDPGMARARQALDQLR